MNAENQVTVTAVIPTFSRTRRELPLRAIKSVLNQTYSNLELHVFDNDTVGPCSPEIQELISNDRRVHYYRNRENIGSINNFELGVESVSSPFFSILSDDDYLAPDFYENALNLFSRYSEDEVEFVVMECALIDELNNIIHQTIDNGVIELVKTDSLRQTTGDPYCWTSMLFRSSLRELLIETNKKKHEIGGDILFLERIRSRYNYIIYYKIGAFFTCHHESFTGQRIIVEEGTPYYVVQLGRYVDIINDEEVNAEIKALYLRKLRHARRRNLLYGWVKHIIILILRDFLLSGSLTQKNIISRNITALRVREGHSVVAHFFSFLYESRILRWFTRLLFLRLYLNYRARKIQVLNKLGTERYDNF